MLSKFYNADFYQFDGTQIGTLWRPSLPTRYLFLFRMSFSKGERVKKNEMACIRNRFLLR
jgi:hypothetical protein